MAAAMKKPDSLIDPSSTSIFPICHSLRVEASTDRGCLGNNPRTNQSECVNRPGGSCQNPTPGKDRLAKHQCGDGRTAPKQVPKQTPPQGHNSSSPPVHNSESRRS